MKEFTFKCWMKAQMAKQGIKNKLNSLMSEEEGGADSLIIAIIIIIILIALAVIFREQLGAMIGKLFGKANDSIDKNFT